MQERQEGKGSPQGGQGTQHAGTVSHRCSKCNQTFDSADDLRRHEEQHHQHQQGQAQHAGQRS